MSGEEKPKRKVLQRGLKELMNDADQTSRLLRRVPAARLRTPETKDESPALDIQAAQPNQGAQPAQGNQPKQRKQGKQGAQGRLVSRVAVEQPPAPVRDFMKVANSISRKAVPEGFFKGKSKQIYDYLYSQTRGAINPRKDCRLTRDRIMRGAHIGSTNTLRDNLLHLRAVGLITWDDKSGEHDGNLYHVRIPEEIGIPMHPAQAAQADQLGQAAQKLPRVPSAVSAQGAQGSSVVDSATSESPKTSFKTTTNDDEAFTKMNGLLSRATYHLTLKNPTPAEQDAWAEVAKVIVEELEAAANRAGSVSSVPAFLAEHLRRRFAKPLRKSREEKPARVPETPPQLEGDPDRRLTPEEITSYAATVTDLLKDGGALEDVTAQFAGSLHPEDWSAIRESATSKVEQKGS